MDGCYDAAPHLANQSQVISELNAKRIQTGSQSEDCRGKLQLAVIALDLQKSSSKSALQSEGSVLETRARKFLAKQR